VRTKRTKGPGGEDQTDEGVSTAPRATKARSFVRGGNLPEEEAKAYCGRPAAFNPGASLARTALAAMAALHRDRDIFPSARHHDAAARTPPAIPAVPPGPLLCSRFVCRAIHSGWGFQTESRHIWGQRAHRPGLRSIVLADLRMSRDRSAGS
jgi:hypothetical protein